MKLLCKILSFFGLKKCKKSDEKETFDVEIINDGQQTVYTSTTNTVSDKFDKLEDRINKLENVEKNNTLEDCELIVDTPSKPLVLETEADEETKDKANKSESVKGRKTATNKKATTPKPKSTTKKTTTKATTKKTTTKPSTKKKSDNKSDK